MRVSTLLNIENINNGMTSKQFDSQLKSIEKDMLEKVEIYGDAMKGKTAKVVMEVSIKALSPDTGDYEIKANVQPKYAQAPAAVANAMSDADDFDEPAIYANWSPKATARDEKLCDMHGNLNPKYAAETIDQETGEVIS